MSSREDNIDGESQGGECWDRMGQDGATMPSCRRRNGNIVTMPNQCGHKRTRCINNACNQGCENVYPASRITPNKKNKKIKKKKKRDVKNEMVFGRNFLDQIERNREKKKRIENKIK